MSGEIIRAKMQGVLEFFGFNRSKPDTARSWQTIRSEDSNGLLSNSVMRFAGPSFVHAAAARNAAGIGMGSQGMPMRPPSSGPSASPNGRFPNWRTLVLGSVFSLLLAFWAPKWTTLLKIGGEAEVVINEVEEVAEVVEKVATVVEKVSEEVAHTLPDNNKIKDAAVIVEHISKQAAKDAHIVEEIIHQIDAAKEDIEEVGKIVEPIIDNIVHDDVNSKQAAQNRPSNT